MSYNANHQLKPDGILLRDFLTQQIAAFRERDADAVESGWLLDVLAMHTTPLGTADQWTDEQLHEQDAHYDDSPIGALVREASNCNTSSGGRWSPLRCFCNRDRMNSLVAASIACS